MTTAANYDPVYSGLIELLKRYEKELDSCYNTPGQKLRDYEPKKLENLIDRTYHKLHSGEYYNTYGRVLHKYNIISNQTLDIRYILKSLLILVILIILSIILSIVKIIQYYF